MTDLAPRPANTGLEEAPTTRIEKFLAFVLGVFVFIGQLWGYLVPLDHDDLAGRFGLVLGALALSFLAFDQLRRLQSRAVTPAMGAIGASTLLAVVMAADYLDLDSAGPIALSLFGIVVTVAAIVAYQRWLAARLPERRARKHECPWCGYPVGSGVAHCEGCGRDVLGDCTTCHQSRRAGVRYCGACGAT